MTIAALVLSLLLARSAAAQPAPQETTPAQTPEQLAAQIKTVTETMAQLQRWRKNAASGKISEERQRRLKQAETDYRSQHDLLLELVSRLELWAYIADNLDHEHTTLTDAEVSAMRRKELDAISELKDVSRADPSPARR